MSQNALVSNVTGYGLDDRGSDRSRTHSASYPVDTVGESGRIVITIQLLLVSRCVMRGALPSCSYTPSRGGAWYRDKFFLLYQKLDD